MAPPGTRIRGTREWAVANIDCCTGCPHDCRYCYARYEAVRKRAVEDQDGWRHPRVDRERVEHQWPLYDGQVMFPTAHDIVPEILDDCIRVIRGLLERGNRVLIVSKPHRECIEKICDACGEYAGSVLFRFTITAMNDDILSFWEPHAPRYAERFWCLQHAYGRGFETSVSIEPMLDPENVAELVAALSPCVTHSIWIGRMNRMEERVDRTLAGMAEELERIRSGQSDAAVRRIYGLLKDNPTVRWKESIKEVVGLPLAEKPGLDI